MDTTSDRLKIHTFGCKVNTYDTGLIEKRFFEAGLSFSQGPQVHVLNTCAVTAEATHEAIRVMRKIKRDHPEAKIVVTGCGAQVDGLKLDHLNDADLVVANSHKAELAGLVQKMINGETFEKVHRSNIFRKDDLGAGGGLESHHTRSFLKIQDGCNSFCSFCIIPYARGKSRSLTIAEMIERVNELYRKGVREVVLTGVHIGDYRDESEASAEADLKSEGAHEPKAGLEDLLENLLNFTKMPSFRMGSFEPPEVTDRLLKIFENPRMAPHFHMSIQSAQTDILKQMKRKYTSDDVERVLYAIRKRLPHAFVGMDVIVGFPGETEELFFETYKRLSELPWSRIHVFPYSERQGTKAALMTEVVYPHVRKARAQRLRELSDDRYKRSAYAQVDTIKNGIVLKSGEEKIRVLSDDYWNIWLPKSARKDVAVGDTVRVHVTGIDSTSLSKNDIYLFGQRVEA